MNNDLIGYLDNEGKLNNGKVNCGKSLKPLNNKPATKNISSFDIETYGDKNKFLMGSVGFIDNGINRFQDSKEEVKVFWDKQKMLNYIINNDKFYRNNFMFATNLQFDLLGLFEDTEEFNNLRFVFRGSRLLRGQYINKNRKNYNNHKYTIKFYDTLNHFKASVKTLGEFIGFEKLEKPSFLGELPKDKEDMRILEDYNIRDSLITLRFSKFLQENYNRIGCQLKMTLPSSSMDLFRRKYLNKPIKQPSRKYLELMYNGYYGGRTEAIKRGKISNVKLYDINSLYPTAMLLYDFPNPNFMYYFEPKDKTDFHSIFNYEGLSQVELITPKNMHIPYLPVKKNNKLLFPEGYIKGFYTHKEIREAVKKGYELIKCHKTIYYTKTHNPFKEFVTDMYRSRLENKNSRYELAYKILMNSLYGKFAQKIEAEPEIRYIDSFTKNEFMRVWNNPYIEIDNVNNYVIMKTKKEKVRIPKYVNPIYSIYTTAYARHLLYQSLPDDVYYMDTDSCITKQKLDTGNMLGEWKKEASIQNGLIVKPKFYFMDDKAKVKGCGNIKVEDVKYLINNRFFNDKKGVYVTPKYKFSKVSKFKESIRRGFSFNEKIILPKEMSLEDDKRIWGGVFNPDKLQSSKPIKLLENDY